MFAGGAAAVAGFVGAVVTFFQTCGNVAIALAQRIRAWARRASVAMLKWALG